MLIHRKTTRSTLRKTVRTLVRVRWRAPDDLGEALVAFRRAIRAHRHLARLAPRFFDSVVVNRERRHREDQRRWMALWEPVLAKVYGTEPEPYNPADDLPPLPHPNTQRAVERELAARAFWMEAGRIALELYRQRRPHDLMDLSRMARLLQIGFDFKLLACGIDPKRPDPEPANHDAAWADLKRAYGHLLNVPSPPADGALDGAGVSIKTGLNAPLPASTSPRAGEEQKAA
jgi:hypothetical protein